MFSSFNTDTKKEHSNQKQQIEIKLYQYGSYGCIYTPEIKCDTGDAGSKMFVSKLMKHTDNLNKEINITNQLYSIKNANLYFAGLLQICGANITNISDDNFEKCPIFKYTKTEQEELKKQENREIIYKDRETIKEKYISAKIRYVGEKNVDEYHKELYVAFLAQLTNQEYSPEKNKSREDECRELIKTKVMSSYFYLLYSIHKMNVDARITHNDIKRENIIIDDKTKYPILIDFGLSFSIDNILSLNEEEKQILEQTQPGDIKKSNVQISDIFFSDQFYLYYCLDIYIIQYIIKVKKQNYIRLFDKLPKIREIDETYSYDNLSIYPTYFETILEPINESELFGLIEEYYSKCWLFLENAFQVIWTNQTEITEKCERIKSYYKTNYINSTKSWKDLYYDLMQEQIITTWDNYSIATSFLIIAGSPLNIEQELKRNTLFDMENNNIVNEWKKTFFATPNERPSCLQSIEIFQTSVFT